MMIRSLLSLSAIVWMLLGTTSPANAGAEAAPQNKPNINPNVEIKIVSRRSAKFSITNHAQKPVRLWSGHPEKLWPSDGNVEYMQKGQWKIIDYSHDLMGREFLLLPGMTTTFELPVFDHLKKGMLVRARVDGYYSNSFVW